MKLTLTPPPETGRLPDNTISPTGSLVVTRYAKAWLDNKRDTALETEYPALVDLFYDIRTDVALAQYWAN